MAGIFIVLIGFPGVGKLTVAKGLAPLFSARVIDNHWINNPILRLLDDVGTTVLPPGIWEETGKVRQAVLDTIVAYGRPEANFIFTTAGVDGDDRSIRTFGQLAEAAGRRQALLVPVRLLCDEQELARRIALPGRSEQLKSVDPKASLERSRKSVVLDPRHRNGLTLDVTFNSPDETIAAVHRHIVELNERVTVAQNAQGLQRDS